MKVPYSWLREYIDIDLCIEEIAEKLTMAGLEVVEIKKLPNLDEPVLDIEVTANRGDCLSIIGIAREIGALTSKQVKYPQALKECSVNKEIAKLIDVSVKNTSLCPRYTGRIIRNVKIAPSPSWLKKRLEAVGIRSINNIVDITNYVLMETGQPLHAFDYNKISFPSIHKSFSISKSSVFCKKSYFLGLKSLNDPGAA